MRRVEQGEERRRDAVLQDTMTIAVADLDFFHWDTLARTARAEEMHRLCRVPRS